MKHKPWLIIGSTAAAHWWPESREPRDLDLLTPTMISAPGIIDAQWHNAGELIFSLNKNKVFADPDVLFTLKVSHAHWNVKWDKTMYDIHFMKKRGCTVNEELYEELIPVWEQVHGKKSVNLNKPVSEFFDDYVDRKYDHELLHELAAFNSRPMHERIRKDHSLALCSKELWDDLTPDEQAQTALEEIIVTSIERFNLRPGLQNSEYRSAASKAHFKLCTSMTKGWFARYLILNRQELLFERLDRWLPHLKQALTRLP